MKRLIGLVSLLTAMVPVVWAVPNSITYQGTLRKNKALVTEKLDMKFEILNGGQSVWTQVVPQVPVENGIFSVVLTPTVDWENIDAYIQITIGKEVMGPPEKLQANPYSLVAKSITDGAVSKQKLDATVKDHLVPTGAILMFSGGCPAGWSVYSSLSGRFPVGVDPQNATQFGSGVTGGTLAHSHSITGETDHKHRLPIFSNSGESIIGTAFPGNDPFGIASGSDLGTVGVHPPQSAFVTFRPVNVAQSDAAGGHNHTGNTGSATSLPPYTAITFCQKN